MDDLKIGDIVQIKPRSINYQIVEVVQQGFLDPFMYECVGFDLKGEERRGVYPEERLIKIENPDQSNPEIIRSSPKEVAEWMKSRVYEKNKLYQSEAVTDIINIFGDDFTHTNNNGNPAINADVLKEFNNITPDVVWAKREFCWYRVKPGTIIKSRSVEYYSGEDDETFDQFI